MAGLDEAERHLRHLPRTNGRLTGDSADTERWE